MEKAPEIPEPSLEKEKQEPDEKEQNHQKDTSVVNTNQVKKEKPEIKKPKDKAPIKGHIKKVVNLNDFSKEGFEKENEDILDFNDQEYNIDDLKAAMSKYSDLLDEKKKIGEAKLLRKKFEYENNVISIIIESPVDESRYNDLKSDLLLFLRKAVKNKSLQMDIKRIEMERVKTVYTPQEKFDYLSQKNPALIELKKRLGLEFEF